MNQIRSHFINQQKYRLICSYRTTKSKFVLSILPHQITEKYYIDMNIPGTKHKCCIELVDGST